MAERGRKKPINTLTHSFCAINDESRLGNLNCVSIGVFTDLNRS
jgi:hypothetical protein